MPLPDRLASADIRIGLETPQIVVSWEFQDDDTWYTQWNNHKLVRSTYDRFPLDDTDGTAVLTEAYSTSPTEAYADTGATADAYNYYAHFIEQEFLGYTDGFVASSYWLDLARQYRTILGFSSDGIASGDWMWFCGVDHSGATVINGVHIEEINTAMVAREIDISAILQDFEEIKNVGNTGAYGVTRCLPIITNQRVLVVDISTDDTMTDTHLLWEDDLVDVVSAGYNVADATAYYSGAHFYFLILDDTNQEVGQVNTNTGPAALLDYSGLSAADYVHSVAWDTNGDGIKTSWICLGYANHLVRFTVASAPWTDPSVRESFHAPYPLTNGAWLVDTTTVQNVWVVEAESRRVYYGTDALDTPDINSYWQDWYDDGSLTLNLFHLNETAAGPVVDAHGLADGTNVGMTIDATGRWPEYYTRGYTATAVNQYIQCGAALIAGISSTSGAIEFQFKMTDAADWDAAGPLYFFKVEDGLGAGVWCYIESGVLKSYYDKGVTGHTASWTMTSAAKDTNWHHIMVTWDTFLATRRITVTFDGDKKSDVNVSTGSSFVVSDVTVGGVPAAFGTNVEGTYAEIRISSDYTRDDNLHTYTDFWHKSAELHEWAGRDYTTTPFEFRDQLYNDFIPEATRLRDETNLIHWQPNTILTSDDNEIVFRGGENDRGHLGALLRLYGLTLDRIIDARDRVIVDQDIDAVSNRHIDRLAKLIGYDNLRSIVEPFSTDELEMWRLRQITKGMVEVWKRKGTLNGMRLFCKLYHIALDLNVVYYRRFWDSVVDPLRTDVDLDSIDMDSYYATAPIGKLEIRAFYKDDAGMKDSNTNGVTGAAGTDTFDSAGSSWNTDPINPGDMLAIMDTTLADQAANGEYRILTVPGATQVTVDHTWTVDEGGLTALDFEIWRYVPAVDPIAEFVMDGLDLLRPRNIILEYQDAT